MQNKNLRVSKIAARFNIFCG